MKKFIFIVFVWFLFQLVFVSMASNSNMAKTTTMTETEKTKFIADCDVDPVTGAIAGILFPITQFTSIMGDFCWNQTK